MSDIVRNIFKAYDAGLINLAEMNKALLTLEAKQKVEDELSLLEKRERTLLKTLQNVRRELQRFM